MYKSRTLKKEKSYCACDVSPLKNIRKKFSTKKKITIREKDVFKCGCNKKLFTCDYEPKQKKKISNNIIY